MPRWILYSAPGSCALASHIALREAGADFDLVNVDFSAGQQRSAEYLAVNPKGRVPALVTADGVLTETPALLAFIAMQYPDARLAPASDTFDFARMQEFNGFLASTVHVAHAHKHRGSRWTDDAAAIEAMRGFVPRSMTACADLIESRLAGPWVLGTAYSVADGYLYTLSGWLEGDGVDMERLPRIREHRRRVGERPAVRQAVAEASG
ncbi:MAG TPA: glutathione S-transferase N-terminal domain-containing protein [Burkholderiaceae bacterium]|nr:glutathione S-transferase N-terminal domain-containing protein [Burkholderiaceae bacterium]